MNFDPRLVALFCILFIGLGIFSILTGRRRMLQARQNEQKAVWYKQIGILTGIEYILLALAFLLNVGIGYGWIPRGVDGLIVPFYLIVLLASALLAGVVIYQGITNARRRRTIGAPVATNQAQTANSSTGIADRDVEDERDMKPEESARLAQKRRERRQKAAQARRRRAGKS